MQTIALIVGVLACVGQAENPQKSLASLLVASNPSAAFTPSGLTSSLPAGSRLSQRAPMMSMSSGSKQERIRNQLFAGAMAVAALAANPDAANAVAASMNEATAGPSVEQLKTEANLPGETIEETIARRYNEDASLLIPGGLIFAAGLALFAQWNAAQDDDTDFFDVYDSRRVEFINPETGDQSGGGKFFDVRKQFTFGDSGVNVLGEEVSTPGSVRVIQKKDNKKSAAALKAAKDAAKKR
mmetsp:Transcript_56980/g.104123  ORF Transcript_56980/g.104123 Transcript_56980/m.104123 type:complete len:241 (+) Transcript_56980:82-804(+)